MRSKLELDVLEDLDDRNKDYAYEDDVFEYEVLRRYTPDLRLPGGIYVEIKGNFKPSDRTKMLYVMGQHPQLDLRLLFPTNNKLTKTSKMRYSDWCERYGIKYHIGRKIPEAWLNE